MLIPIDQTSIGILIHQFVKTFSEIKTIHDVDSKLLMTWPLGKLFESKNTRCSRKKIEVLGLSVISFNAMISTIPIMNIVIFDKYSTPLA